MQTLFDAPPAKPGLFGRFRRAVSRTRDALADQIGDILEGKREIDPELVEDLEMTLIGADIGVRTTNEILEEVRKGLEREQLRDSRAIKDLIARRMLEILAQAGNGAVPAGAPRALEVILVVGVNGVGKTTTIGKLAARLGSEGRRVMLCAADTFRAAAAEQLTIWGERAGCPVIRQKPGADPSAVLYDGLQAAKARGFDTVIVDTAGRLHNKAGLMAELQKIRRTAGRLVLGAPHQVLLVLDAVTGQNGLEQARQFTSVAGVTGLVLAKLDGTAKGGIVVAIARELGLPIRWVGIGERAEDLVVFHPESFVRSLFSTRDEE
jgi:fused signal recognition particle receptor